MVRSWGIVGQTGVGRLVGTTSRRHSLVPTVRPGAHGNDRFAIGARNTSDADVKDKDDKTSGPRMTSNRARYSACLCSRVIERAPAADREVYDLRVRPECKES
jgi:hypothetical protein